MASECKDIEKLGLFYKKTIFFKKVVFENFPKNSASIEKLLLNGSSGFGLGIGVIQTQKFDFEYLDPNFES